jgi:uncharacterized membrane protein YsdA (DUF1294 family)
VVQFFSYLRLKSPHKGLQGPIAKNMLENSRIHNEKTITLFHETKRVTALTSTDFILGLYAVFNIVAFLLYARDKRKAKVNAWRTPENLLLLVATLGPFGAYGAMIIFRHKTQKLKFYLVPAFLIIHLVAIIFILG